MAVLKVRVKPGARRELIELMPDGRLKISVKEPARESKANHALVKLLARKLRVPRSDVEIKSGQTSRDKIIEIKGLDMEEIRRRLGFG